MMRALAIVAALALAGCGAGFGNGEADAGPTGDAGGCQIVLSITPVVAVAPTTLQATATAQGAAGLGGYSWTATDPDGQPLNPTPINSDTATIDAPKGGVYHIVAFGTGDFAGCSDGAQDKNVQVPGANTQMVRLRYTPLPSDNLPPQDDSMTLVVPGGADLTVGARSLDPGVAVSGAVSGPSGHMGAELRVTPSAGGRTQLLYADAQSGAFSGHVVNGALEVVVVPYDYDVAPASLAGQSTLAQVTLDAGDPVTGVVLGAGGAPLAGAWVSIAAGGLPPTLAQTAADGTFTARARISAGSLRVSVAPPAGSGLAALDAPPLALTGAAPIQLALADVPSASVTVTARSSGGVLLPGARVTFLAADVPGGSVTESGMSHAAAGRVQLVGIADASGKVSVTLPLASYVLVVEPGAGAPAGQVAGVTPLDLAAGPPGGEITVFSAAVTPVTIKIVDGAGQPVAGARVVAVSRGVMGAAAGIAVAGTSDDVQGAVSLGLAPALGYDLVVEPPAGKKLARKRLTFAAGAPPATIALVASIDLVGTVQVAGSPVAGVRVAAHCVSCAAGQSPVEPLGEGVSGPGGTFRLSIPDPGVTP